MFPFKTLASQERAAVDFGDLHWLPVATVSSSAPSVLAPLQGGLRSVLCACGRGREEEDSEGPRFRTAGPSRYTRLFHSFSAVIGVGAGAGAYVLSRYAVRD